MMVVMGLLLVVVGVIVMWLGKGMSSENGFGWLGRLPGDFLIKRDNFTFYFPLATSLLISLVGSLILYFLMKR